MEIPVWNDESAFRRVTLIDELQHETVHLFAFGAINGETPSFSFSLSRYRDAVPQQSLSYFTTPEALDPSHKLFVCPLWIDLVSQSDKITPCGRNMNRGVFAKFVISVHLS